MKNSDFRDFPENPYPILEAFAVFAVFWHHWTHWDTTVGQTEKSDQNPYPILEGLFIFDCFSLKTSRKWRFSKCQVCRWHFGEKCRKWVNSIKYIYIYWNSQIPRENLTIPKQWKSVKNSGVSESVKKWSFSSKTAKTGFCEKVMRIR